MLHLERIEGRKAGPALVYLHHGLGCCALWKDFPRKLSQATDLPALLYDRSGHGLSAPSPGPRREGFFHREVQVLTELLDQEGIRDFILIGHSDGGTISLLHAAEGARRPRGVISVAAHLFIEPVTRTGIRATVDAYTSGMRERLMRYHGAQTDRLFWDWAGYWLSPKFDSWNISRELAGVECPVLAIQGADDEYGTIAQLDAIRANARGPVETVLIPGCAHEPHHQAFDATFSAMRRAIASWL